MSVSQRRDERGLTAGGLGLGDGSEGISGVAAGQDADGGAGADSGKVGAHASVVGEAESEAGSLDAGALWF